MKPICITAWDFIQNSLTGKKMWAIADHITDENAIRTKAEDILETFDIAPDKDGKAATVETVWEMAKYVVAFEEWVKRGRSWNGGIPL